MSSKQELRDKSEGSNHAKILWAKDGKEALPTVAAINKSVRTLQHRHDAFQKNKHRSGGMETLDHFLSSPFKFPVALASTDSENSSCHLAHLHGTWDDPKTYQTVAADLAKELSEAKKQHR